MVRQNRKDWVSCLDEVGAVCNLIQQSFAQTRIGEHRPPFREEQIRGHDQNRFLGGSTSPEGGTRLQISPVGRNRTSLSAITSYLSQRAATRRNTLHLNNRLSRDVHRVAEIPVFALDL